MLHVYEFEVFESEGWFLALPFDMDGGTQGATFAEACEMAADWLKTMGEHWAMAGEDAPEATFGNEPEHGGKTVIVAVDAGIDTVKAVSASEAADMLGVSRPRVSQMIKANQLVGFRKGRDTLVTLDSVNARLSDKPKSGRPKTTA